MDSDKPVKMELDSGIPGKLETVCPKKIKEQRHKRQTLLLIDLFLEFSKNTTVHGLRYITDIGLSAAEKLFWILTVTISLIVCFLLIHRVWYKWMYSPAIVLFSERMIPVEEVLFPSITVCSQWKCDTENYNYMDQRVKYAKYQTDEAASEYNMTRKELETLEDTSLVCEDDLKWDERHLVDRDITDSSLVTNLIKMSPSRNDLFVACKWQGIPFVCSSAFKQALTEEGVCFNFNALSNDVVFKPSVQLDYSYVEIFEKDKMKVFENSYGTENAENISISYPLYGREFSAEPDLEFALQENSERNDLMCNSNSNGFKIYVQHPGDMPQSFLYYYTAISGQETSLAIKATILNTSESLKGYQPDQRQCYFPGDPNLKYFKTYTPDNCRLECLSLYTYQKCGCVWFHMPHYNSSELCTLQKSKCVKEARKAFASRKLEPGYDHTCDCLPLCDSTRYDAEMLKTNFDFKKTLNAYSMLLGLNDSSGSWLDGWEFSKVKIYFRDHSFVSMRRSELFGVSDFMANCGGLMGLFFGFSFLSLVEILYFCTLRLWCTFKKDIREEKKSRPESS